MRKTSGKIFCTLLSAVLAFSGIPVLAENAGNEAVPISAKNNDIVVISAKADEVVPISAKDPEKIVESSSEELEKIIKIVKPKLSVPDDYTEFSWDYQKGYNKAHPSNWTLAWAQKKEALANGANPASITVICDSYGRISYYYNNKNDVVFSGRALPVYTKDDLKKTAEDFFKKISPESCASFEYTDAESMGLLSKKYGYNFVRKENGIIYPSDRAMVAVDFITGEVTGFSLDCNFDAEIADSKDIISQNEAVNKLSETLKMELLYKLRTSVDKDGKTTKKACLVYTPNLYYITVDAHTGEVYLTDTVWNTGKNDTNKNDGLLAADKNTADSGSGEKEYEYVLSREELEQLEILSKLIKKEDAIKAVTENKNLYLNPLLTAVEASLSKRTPYYAAENGGDAEYIWNISFSNPQNDNGYYTYADACVDAQTGKIISFYSRLNNYNYYKTYNKELPKIKYSDEQLQKIFEEFAKEQIPQYFDKARLSSNEKANVIEIKTVDGNEEYTYGATRLNYTRVNEGVDFTYNNIYGTVDGVTGKISSFGYRWDDDIEFESVKNAISAKEAFDIYTSLPGFGLFYETATEYTFTPERLETNSDKFKAFVQALFLERDLGSGEYDKICEKYAKGIDVNKVYENIDDEESIVQTAADFFGVSKDDYGYFYSDYENLYSVATKARLCYGAYNFSGYISALGGKNIDYAGEEIKKEEKQEYTDISSHWAEREIRLITDAGAVEEQSKFRPDEYITAKEFKELFRNCSYYSYGEYLSDDNSEVSRIDAIKYIIDSLGYTSVAKLAGIYKTDFADGSDIAESDVGFAAIAKGLGIVEGDENGNISAYNKLTRAQTVKLIFNTIKAGKA